MGNWYYHKTRQFLIQKHQSPLAIKRAPDFTNMDRIRSFAQKQLWQISVCNQILCIVAGGFWVYCTLDLEWLAGGAIQTKLSRFDILQLECLIDQSGYKLTEDININTEKVSEKNETRKEWERAGLYVPMPSEVP